LEVNTKNKDNIEIRLNDIFKDRFKIDFDGKEKELLNANLLGSSIYLTPTDLLYLFRDIENEFDINIPQKEVVDGKFSSFNNIVEIICSQVE
jgi:peptide maturation system acyl carrier-related protein